MQSRMDTQQIRLDSLEDLLDVMAVGNPVMQRALDARRAALDATTSFRVHWWRLGDPTHDLLEPFHSFFFILFPFVLYYEFKYL
ncbi:hypothetical protein Bca52824_084438 [Brassica carinata]|uniref:Uncharacterized protein n=1 Tax=Brassica carinata TaxID=52824 RepID=A0A8X7PNN7_BRACI|nr:hypothetical protein Bca52824_084438 [Brassica carinata]